MALVQVRIDDRLIHGQVVVGWRQILKPDRIMLCSDEVANSDWQRTIYMSAVPPETAASVLTLADTVTSLLSGEFSLDRVILLVDDPKYIVDLVNAGVKIEEVNVGGMHFKPGKNQISPFIFVDDRDIEHFRVLYQKGIYLEGRDVPTRQPVNIAKELKFCPVCG
jgi:mannose/fructose/N-acetylgalactosamine-specific phosphotransferase system component IIB